MLIRCPECYRQVDEAAASCSKCGFVFDDITRAAQKKKTIDATRQYLGITAGILLAIWLLFAVVTFTANNSGHYVGTGDRQAAYEKFQRGEALSDSDVDYLANGPRHISPEEERAAGRTFFSYCSVVFGLPGLIIVLHLYFTRQQFPEE